ncbi:hypothetical protein AB0C76_32880 [Kitasatospora sp. NPDC048722]|uniref:hypothetical protein n=1 Tax=Kitasatospora sp. NPDC048722 TaxID=3155639 RepID=UPI0033EE9BFE
MAKKFTAVNVEPAGRDALRVAAVNVSAILGRRVSMSDTLRVLAALAAANPQETAKHAHHVLDDDTDHENNA